MKNKFDSLVSHQNRNSLPMRVDITLTWATYISHRLHFCKCKQKQAPYTYRCFEAYMLIAYNTGYRIQKFSCTNLNI